jgi:transcriptional regulator of acetoin/glycerol metabolism
LLETTIPTTQNRPDEGLHEAPGLVVITTGNEVCWAVLPLLPPALSLTLGRGHKDSGVELDDPRMSRRHATFERREGEWLVTDHDSTNGTFLDGTPVKGRVGGEDGSLVRLGNTLVLLVDDVRPFGTFPLQSAGGLVIGPTLRLAHERITQAAAAGQAVLLRGESGTGKELAASTFHRATRGGKPGPLVIINCATIPAGLAERLLFGARKGAYSGADMSADGYFQAADGGTLFLDEIAELDPLVQPKLLRVLESGEATPLGATRSTAVDVRICCATHADLRARVVAGSFRQDLYFRLARCEVELPPLRERREEFPALIAALLASGPAGGTIKAEASFVEQLACRHWPGNLRELGIEVHRGAMAAVTAGRTVLKSTDLAPRAGIPFAPPGGVIASAAPPPDDPIAQALEAEQGNVSRAAARLGLSRNKVRRWVEKYGAKRPASEG